MKSSWLIILVFYAGFLSAAQETISLEELRMEKRFGFGFSAAGPLSALGMEIDMNLNENFSLGAGLGTGMDYSTFMIKGRYFILGKSVSPYFAVGFARWWTKEPLKKGGVSPAVLQNVFLAGEKNQDKGFDIYIVYPAFGVQFMHPMGLAVSAEVQYLFKLFNMSSGTYAGLGIHWYF